MHNSHSREPEAEGTVRSEKCKDRYSRASYFKIMSIVDVQDRNK